MLKQTWQSVLAVRLSNLNFAFIRFQSAFGHLTNQFNLSYLFAMQTVKSKRRSLGSSLKHGLLLGIFALISNRKLI